MVRGRSVGRKTSHRGEGSDVQGATYRQHFGNAGAENPSYTQKARAWLIFTGPLAPNREAGAFHVRSF